MEELYPGLTVAGFPVEGTGLHLPGQVLENTLELAGELTVRHARAFSERIGHLYHNCNASGVRRSNNI